MKVFNKNIKIYAAVAALGLIASCKPTIEIKNDSTPESGIDFSNYIAIGNSLTAGFADGGLYLSSQQNSFPNMIAEQMKRFGGGEFITPYFSEAQRNGSGYIRLKSLVNGNPEIENVTTDLAIRGFYNNDRSKPLYTKFTGTAINNLGVPGLRLDMVETPGLGTPGYNPYFERLLPDNDLTTYFSYATSKNHTFFSFGLGNNDVLGYATNGAVTTLDPTKTLISKETFKDKYNKFINKLTEKGQKGIVATIPDVTATPYFNTVTTKALLAAVGPQATAIYIETKAAPYYKVATDKDLFVLPFRSANLLGVPNSNDIPYGLHPSNPVTDNWVLDENEVKEVQNRILELNEIIREIANNKKLAIADIYTFFNEVKNGYNYNGVVISNGFITGNVFSLDGIHLTPMGYAIMANVFIDAINANYGTSLGKVDAAQYPGVLMP